MSLSAIDSITPQSSASSIPLPPPTPPRIEDHPLCRGWLSKRATAFPYTSKTRLASLHAKARSESVDLVTFEDDDTTIHKRYAVVDVNRDEQSHLVFKLRGGGELIADLLGDADASRWLQVGERVRGALHSGLAGMMFAAEI